MLKDKFSGLLEEAINLSSRVISTEVLSSGEIVTEFTLEAEKATEYDSLKAAEGIINCKIKSVILPLLGDHVCREASHYLRLLKSYT
ncbi:MAG: hypothetical protein K0R09_1070 [Clostridiales bacterium]|jgi:hypothetical protein|nr:hypothetical protein [Clostridiales bacterium]